MALLALTDVAPITFADDPLDLPNYFPSRIQVVGTTDETPWIIEVSGNNGATWASCLPPGADDFTSHAPFLDQVQGAVYRIRVTENAGDGLLIHIATL